MTQNLLTPVRLGALELTNRVVMAPLTRCRCDNDGYVPTEEMGRYYADARVHPLFRVVPGPIADWERAG